DRNGTAKIADFGLACCSNHKEQKVSQVAGTVGYACPHYVNRGVVTEGSEAKFSPEVAADFAALGLRGTEYQEEYRPFFREVITMHLITSTEDFYGGTAALARRWPCGRPRRGRCSGVCEVGVCG
ncbi:unnamed protein product, partial [Symbiodinium natans]